MCRIFSIRPFLLVTLSLMVSCEKPLSYDISDYWDMTMTKIWSQPGTHTAFTDLIEYQGVYYCVFREATKHAVSNPNDYGKIRVISSLDGVSWDTYRVISNSGYDLRDPKLSINPDGNLLLLCGGLVWDGYGGIVRRETFTTVIASMDQSDISTDPANLLMVQKDEVIKNSILWELTWHNNIGYGVAYKSNTDYTSTYLVSTVNGMDFSVITELSVPQSTATPMGLNEVSLDFGNDDILRVIARSRATEQAVYAECYPPYLDWDSWHTLPICVGGPNLKTINGTTYLGTRGEGTSLYIINTDTKKLYRIASSDMYGDTGYPGIIMVGGQIWMSFYYSESTTAEGSIYLMRIAKKQRSAVIQ